jgi:hypothetical protein
MHRADLRIGNLARAERGDESGAGAVEQLLRRHRALVVIDDRVVAEFRLDEVEQREIRRGGGGCGKGQRDGERRRGER